MALINELTGDLMMNATLQSWLNLSREELDEIYRQASPGPLPTGDTRGTAIVTGALLPRTLARIAKLFAWQGKVFDIFADNGNSGVLINKVTPFSLNFIVAKVYRGNSWLDQKDTIIIDYSSTSFFAKIIRDEIRQVEPGLYLGKVWWRKTRVLDFALSCPEQVGQEVDQAASSSITPKLDTNTGDMLAGGRGNNIVEKPAVAPAPETINERVHSMRAESCLVAPPIT